MMQVTVDQIIDMIAVRHRLVPAAGTVLVSRLVALAAMLRRAAVGIAGRDLYDVLIDVIAMGMVQVPVVKVVGVVAMPNGGVSAVGPVLMRVIGVVGMRARGHGWPPWSVSKTSSLGDLARRRHRMAPGAG
jgi:hypothetical protein